MRQWWVFIALAVVTLTAWPVTGQTVADQLIVPGERVSALTLGLPMNQGIATAITVFGGGLLEARPCRSAPERPPDEQCVIRTRDVGGRVISFTFVGLPGDERLVLIWFVGFPEYRTAEGFRVRMPAADIARGYGSPTYTGNSLTYAPGRQFDTPEGYVWHWWTSRGIAAIVSRASGTVIAIAVLRAQ